MNHSITQTFKSGEEYAIGCLFSDDNRINIPDLQRDYCWGDKVFDKNGNKIGEIVTGFVESLLDLFNQPTEFITLGVVYGYEQPIQHINLCDGQQRLTTLFLLLGKLNRETGGRFTHNLQSQSGDSEPLLQYTIRESTLYFLKDLVDGYFLKPDVLTESIKFQDWYFVEYDNDPSIQSMLTTIQLINIALAKVQIDYSAFGDFICEKVKLLYFNLESRENGEKSFVIINTTGEPLTPTENLKPILITQQSPEVQNEYASEWECWEQWFWQKRDNNLTADNGLNEFFRWVAFLEESKQDQENYNDKNAENLATLLGSESGRGTLSPTQVSRIPFKRIRVYFEITQTLFETGVFSDESKLLHPNEDGNDLLTWFKLLPVIAFVVKFKVDEVNLRERDILRIKHYFENQARVNSSRRDDISKAIQLVAQLPSSDFVSMLDIGKHALPVSSEEKEKLEIYRGLSSEQERIDMEERFWEAEKHAILKGEIHVLIKWATKEEKFIDALFDKYYKTFCDLFGNGKNTEDLVRRSLLTLGFSPRQYPFIYQGNKNLTFCSKPEQWQKLIKAHPEKIGYFVKDVSESPDSLNDTMKNMINAYANNNPDQEHPIPIEFITNKRILGYCKDKFIQWWGNDIGWVLMSQTNAKAKFAIFKTYALWIYLEETKIDNLNEWGTFEFYNKHKSSTVFIDNKQLKVAVDIVHRKANTFELQLFARNETIENKVWLEHAAEACDLKLDESIKRYKSEPQSKADTINLLKSVIAYQPQSTTEPQP